MRIGDRFRIGSAEFVVTQPRLPGYKLDIRFGRMADLRAPRELERPYFRKRLWDSDA